jgi:hypothetical protein
VWCKSRTYARRCSVFTEPVSYPITLFGNLLVETGRDLPVALLADVLVDQRRARRLVPPCGANEVTEARSGTCRGIVPVCRSESGSPEGRQRPRSLSTGWQTRSVRQAPRGARSCPAADRASDIRSKAARLTPSPARVARASESRLRISLDQRHPSMLRLPAPPPRRAGACRSQLGRSSHDSTTRRGGRSQDGARVAGGPAADGLTY